MICFLSGPVKGGKTTTAGAIISTARKRGLTVGGILCPGELADGARMSIRIINLFNDRVSQLTDAEGPGVESIGRFNFTAQGLEFAREALRAVRKSLPDLAVVDEIGPLELAGRGWAAEAEALVDAYRTDAHGLLLLVVRERRLDQVRVKWGLASAPAERADAAGAKERVLKMLKLGRA